MNAEDEIQKRTAEMKNYARCYLSNITTPTPSAIDFLPVLTTLAAIVFLTTLAAIVLRGILTTRQHAVCRVAILAAATLAALAAQAVILHGLRLPLL